MSLADSIRRWKPPPRPPIDERPSSAYEITTRRQLEALTDQVKALDGRISTLFWGIAALVLAEVIRAVLG